MEVEEKNKQHNRTHSTYRRRPNHPAIFRNHQNRGNHIIRKKGTAQRIRKEKGDANGESEWKGTAQRIPEKIGAFAKQTARKKGDAEGEPRKGLTSSERALRNPCTKAIKTEICLSEASSFPFSLGAGVLARAGAVLIFASFHLRKRRY